MKIPVSWLREWVDIPWDAAELSRRLTASGFEVEGVEPAAPDFSGVVVAEIVSMLPDRRSASGDSSSVVQAT